MSDLPLMLIPPTMDAQLEQAVTRLPATRTRESLVNFIRYGVPVGDFLLAVLSNNLRAACHQADAVNARALAEYVQVLTNHAPAECWGSREAVRNWIDRGQRLRRWGQIAETEADR